MEAVPEDSPRRGPCDKCGAPGLLQHAPAPIPASGTWCDRCFNRMVWRANTVYLLWKYRVLVLLVIAVAIAFAKKALAQA